tara:strand:+ start:754 stop:1329 length:576 start_codon:yes stop_codon:yes gene_type:complete
MLEEVIIKKYGFNTLRECLIEIDELGKNKQLNKNEIIKKLNLLSMKKSINLSKKLKTKKEGNFSSEYNSYLKAKKNGNNKMIQELKKKYGNKAINNYIQTHSQTNLLRLRKKDLKKVATNYFNKNYKSESLKPKKKTVSFMNNSPNPNGGCALCFKGGKQYINLQKGGKRLIHTGLRGGKYYMKGGRKIYI